MKLMKEPSWKSIIERIQKRGLTQKDIEKSTGVPQGYISIMKLGKYKRVSYVVGTAIMKLWEGIKSKEKGK